METLTEKSFIERTVIPKPYVGLWQGIGRTDYKFWQLIAELIDNTMTVDAKTNCRVTIDTIEKTARIDDDSIGIPGKNLHDVISLGKKVNQGKQLFSFSGIGLKAALSALGIDFVIRTKPRSENNKFYELTPDFTLDDEHDKEATFTVKEYYDEDIPYGTSIIIKGLKSYPKNSTSFKSMIRYIGATYADYLENDDLKLTFKYIQSEGTTRVNVEPVRPLLSNKNNIIDTDLILGENEPEFKNVELECKNKKWKVLVSAGRKAYPESAEKYYKSENRKLYDDVYGTESSPYGWSERTSGVQFKSSGIGKDNTKGKILLFHQLGASSRAESVWCEVTIVKGIEPGMIKSTLNEQTENFTEMEKALKKWLTKNDFRKRNLVGTASYGESKEVRDKWKESLKDNEKLRYEYGISLDSFDQDASTETDIKMGRPDIFIDTHKRTIVVECKKEEIKPLDVSQAAGYAVETEADSIILVAQRMTAGAIKAQEMWAKKLNIPIIFDAIQKLYVK